MHLLYFLSQALENKGAAVFSESEALTESECDLTSDSMLSDYISSKDSPVHTDGKKKNNP